MRENQDTSFLEKKAVGHTHRVDVMSSSTVPRPRGTAFWSSLGMPKNGHLLHAGGNSPRRLLHLRAASAIEEALNVTLKLFNVSAVPNGSRPNAVHYNPHELDDGSVLYNVRCGEFGGVAGTKVVWVGQRGNVLSVIDNAEDARAVRLHGRVLVLFTRYFARQRKDVWLAKMPVRRAISNATLLQSLVAPGVMKVSYRKRLASEGNWLPFVHRGSLFVSYSLCPHTVLALDPDAANASLAFSYESERMRSRCAELDETGKGGELSSGHGLRGSAPGMGYPSASPGGSSASSANSHHHFDSVVGLGHIKGGGRGGSYYHFFFRRNAQPPFDLLAISDLFRFPPFLSRLPAFKKQPRIDATQYCTSLRVDAADGSLHLAYVRVRVRVRVRWIAPPSVYVDAPRTERDSDT